MAAIIKIKRSTTEGAVPSGGALAAGELAVNLADGILFSSSDGSDIVRISEYALSNTNSAISQLNTNLTSTNTAIRSLITTQTSRVDLVNTNLTSTNTALRTLISDRAQVANVAALAALANTNSGIAQINTNLTSTNTALRTLISDRMQVANAEAIGFTATTYHSGNSTITFTAADGTSPDAMDVNIAGSLGTDSLARTGIVNTNTALRTLIGSNLANTNSYIASVQSDVDTNESTERAALANTNSAISQLNTNLTSTNTAIRSLVSTQTARVDLVNTNLTSTNTALRTLISDRLQVANADNKFQTITVERAALANTNSYIASVQTDVDNNEATERAALANTNSYIATKVDSAGPTTSGLFAHTGRATISTNLTVSGNTHIDGNLTVEGGVTYISTSTLNVDDTMVKLAANNAADTVDTGIYGKYVITGNSAVKYSGYFRDATDGVFKFYEDLDTEPTSTVNTSDNNYNLAQLDAIIDGGTY